MPDIKHELQNIILGDGPPGQHGKLKKAPTFLRTNAETGITIKQQNPKSKEEATLLVFFIKNKKGAKLSLCPLLYYHFILITNTQKFINYLPKAYGSNGSSGSMCRLSSTG